MTNGNPSNGRDLSIWEAQVLRLTAFTSQPTDVDDLNWWSELTGQVPESRQSKPKLAQFSEEGLFDGGKLTLSVLPTRVDWQYAPVPDKEREDDRSPTLGPFPQALERFSGFMFTWLESSAPPVQRLAFGAVLLRPVESRQQGYALLTDYLPSVRLDPSGSEDFFYMINRPREASTLIEHKLNRLSKWSVGMETHSTVSVGAAGSKIFNSGQSFHCRLELDISTAAGFQGDFSREQLAQILDELLALGREIATEGDIP